MERIQALYDQANASVQLNGSLAGSIPIRSGVRQGCPLSVALYALCLHPFVRALEDSLPSIKIGRNSQQGPVIAYADDVTVFVTNPGDFHAIQQAIKLYERATGAKHHSTVIELKYEIYRWMYLLYAIKSDRQYNC